jgi:hypothetical protein
MPIHPFFNDKLSKMGTNQCFFNVDDVLTFRTACGGIWMVTANPYESIKA